MFKGILAPLIVAKSNFSKWHRNLRIIVCFVFAFITCFLLSDKVVDFAKQFGTTMQLVEPFIWVFGDSNSILLISVLLIFLFMDMPFITPATPLFLMRTNRTRWMVGQFLYIIAATFIFLAFVLLSTILLCGRYCFIGDKWSPTAAILGYGNNNQNVVLPVMLKTLEMSFPYRTMITIFLLMLMYSLVLVFIMLFFNIRFGQRASFISAFAFSVYGMLLNPETIKKVLGISEEMMYKANVAVGWLSPLNHATYHMHNFGYDRLPTLTDTALIFIGLLAVLFILSSVAMKKYNFNFTGTEK